MRIPIALVAFAIASCSSGGEGTPTAFDQGGPFGGNGPKVPALVPDPPREDTPPKPDVGIDVSFDAPVDTKVPVDTGPKYKNCSECLGANCRSEFDNCSAIAACQAGIDCLNGCSDNTCRDQCLVDNPGAEFATLVTCLKTKCAANCYPP